MPKSNQDIRHLIRLSDDALLDMRLCDLPLRIQETNLQNRVEQLYDELESRGLKFRPHVWLSDDWYSPDGIPGIAIPFFLAHKRLARLERKQLLEVEGGTQEWCMKILRHEAGHALDTAFRLRRRRKYRELFGKVSQPYPKYYRPEPNSKRYVMHLDMWYAQSHPVEDFAETFAVWLKPRSRWRSRYRDWPALKKLEYVHDLMHELKGEKPLVRSRIHVDSLRTLRTTLRDHYQKKRQHYGVDHPSFYDRDLFRLFSDDLTLDRRPTAATFLRKCRTELRRAVSHGTGEYPYTVDQILSEMISRCRELKLRLRNSEDQTLRDATVLLTVQTMNYLHAGHHRIAM